MVVSLHRTPTPTPTPTLRVGRRSSCSSIVAKTTRRARSVVLVRWVLNHRPIHPSNPFERERAVFWRVFDGFVFFILYSRRPLRLSARASRPGGGGGWAETKRERERRSTTKLLPGKLLRFSSRVNRKRFSSRRLEGEIKREEEGCVDDYAAPVFLLSCALFLSFFLSLSLFFSLCVGLSLRVSLCVCFLR